MIHSRPIMITFERIEFIFGNQQRRNIHSLSKNRLENWKIACRIKDNVPSMDNWSEKQDSQDTKTFPRWFNLCSTPALTLNPPPRERKLRLNDFGFADDRPANPTAGFVKDAARVSPSNPSPVGQERVAAGRPPPPMSETDPADEIIHRIPKAAGVSRESREIHERFSTQNRDTI